MSMESIVQCNVKKNKLHCNGTEITLKHNIMEWKLNYVGM